MTLRTGDRVRIEVIADHAGYVRVFNIGPTGNLNLLVPDDAAAGPTSIAPHRPLHVVDVEMEPPTGRERLFAVWSARPLPLDAEQLMSLADGGAARSRPYRATRDMKRIRQTMEHIPATEWHAVVLELEHTS